jgi:hypothetical protein
MILYLELKLRPISIIKIKSNYWMKLLEIALLFILFRNTNKKTILRMINIKKYAAIDIGCYAFINSNIVEQEEKSPIQ